MQVNVSLLSPFLYILMPLGAFFAAFAFARASYKNGLTTAQEQLTKTYKELLDADDKKIQRITHQNIALKDEMHRLRRKVKYDLDHHHQSQIVAQEMAGIVNTEQEL